MKELNIAVIGHVDHGKSTLIGRILYESGALSAEKVHSVTKGDSQINFAHLLDAFSEEQNEGKTINSMRVSVPILDRNYVFFDVPGHAEFIDQMAMSTSKVQHVIMVIDAQEGIQKQTLHHLKILSFFDVKNIIVVINKMDRVHYDEKEFCLRREEIKNICKDFDIYILNVIPIVAQNGDNILKQSNRLSWYDNETLLETLKNINLKDKSFCDNVIFSVQDAYEAKKKQLVFGKIVMARENIQVPKIFYNVKNEKKYFVDDVLNISQESIEEVCHGNAIALVFHAKTDIARGDVLVQKKNDIYHTSKISVRILWIGNKKHESNKQYVIRLSTQVCNGKIILDSKSLKSAQNESLEKGGIVDGKIVCDDNLSWSFFDYNISLGTVLIYDGKKVSGIAII